MNNYEYDYLAHHGIKGQKWGIRRFQNPDGTLTEAGKKRNGGKEKKDSFIKTHKKEIALVGIGVAVGVAAGVVAAKGGVSLDSIKSINFSSAKDKVSNILKRKGPDKKPLSDFKMRSWYTSAEEHDKNMKSWYDLSGAGKTKKSSSKFDLRNAVKNRRHLSDVELESWIKRLKNQKEFKNLAAESLHPNRTYLKQIGKNVGSRALSTLGTGALLYGAKAAIQQNVDRKELANALYNGGPKKK